MRKIFSLFLYFIFTSILISFTPLLFAEESITITTYYPSPYGSYNQLYVTDKLGIGTTPSTAALDVTGNVLFGDSTAQQVAISTISGIPTIYTWNRPTSTHTPLSIRVQSSPQLYLNTDGNVGIGTATPAVALDVIQNKAIKVGQAYLSSGGNYVHLATNEWFNGSVWTRYAPGILLQLVGSSGAYIHYHTDPGGHYTWATVTSTSGWQAGSSKTYKQNIKALTDVDYERLRKEFRSIKLFSYNRKDTPKEQEVGFIAEYAPDLILASDKSNVTLLKAIGYLAAIAKGQEKAVTSLQKEIKELKSEMEGFKKLNKN